MNVFAKIHCNLGYRPLRLLYSALCRAYSIESNTSGLNKSQKIISQCKGFQLYAKQTNRYRKMPSDRCIFNVDVTIHIMFV